MQTLQAPSPTTDHPRANRGALRFAWRDVVFLNWRMEPQQLAGHLPGNLALEEHDGSAWLSLVIFRMRIERLAGVRARGHTFAQANLRTYVRRRGRRGIRFLAVDAPSDALNVLQRLLGLPSRPARVGVAGSVVVAPRGKPPFTAQLSVAAEPADSRLDRFLAEPRVAYLGRFGWPRLHVAHEPWPLHPARTSRHVPGFMAGFTGARPPDHAMASPGVDVAAWLR